MQIRSFIYIRNVFNTLLLCAFPLTTCVAKCDLIYYAKKADLTSASLFDKYVFGCSRLLTEEEGRFTNNLYVYDPLKNITCHLKSTDQTVLNYELTKNQYHAMVMTRSESGTFHLQAFAQDENGRFKECSEIELSPEDYAHLNTSPCTRFLSARGSLWGLTKKDSRLELINIYLKDRQRRTKNSCSKLLIGKESVDLSKFNIQEATLEAVSNDGRAVAGFYQPVEGKRGIFVYREGKLKARSIPRDASGQGKVKIHVLSESEDKLIGSYIGSSEQLCIFTSHSKGSSSVNPLATLTKPVVYAEVTDCGFDQSGAVCTCIRYLWKEKGVDKSELSVASSMKVGYALHIYDEDKSELIPMDNLPVVEGERLRGREKVKLVHSRSGSPIPVMDIPINDTEGAQYVFVADEQRWVFLPEYIQNVYNCDLKQEVFHRLQKNLKSSNQSTEVKGAQLFGRFSRLAASIDFMGQRKVRIAKHLDMKRILQDDLSRPWEEYRSKYLQSVANTDPLDLEKLIDSLEEGSDFKELYENKRDVLTQLNAAKKNLMSPSTSEGGGSKIPELKKEIDLLYENLRKVELSLVCKKIEIHKGRLDQLDISAGATRECCDEIKKELSSLWKSRVTVPKEEDFQITNCQLLTSDQGVLVSAKWGTSIALFLINPSHGQN